MQTLIIAKEYGALLSGRTACNTSLGTGLHPTKSAFVKKALAK